MHEAYAHNSVVTPVEAYASTPGDAYAALDYPFLRPEGSFYTDGENVTKMPDELEAFMREANIKLAETGLPLIEDRIPVIGYGSNVSPARLREKMNAYGPYDFADELQTVPMLRASMQDIMTVWHGTPSSTGSAFAEVYDGPEAKGEQAECVVQFLTKEQLAFIHKTEGSTYHFAPLEATTIDGQVVQAYAYVANKSHILLKDGKPVSMKLPNQQGGEGMTAREAVAHMLEMAGSAAPVRTPEELVDAYGATNIKGRGAYKAALVAAMNQNNTVQSFSFNAPVYAGRADFSSVANSGHATEIIEMPEQVLARLRPDMDAYKALVSEFESQGIDYTEAMRKADVRLDILRAIRRQATDDIEQRINNSDK